MDVADVDGNQLSHARSALIPDSFEAADLGKQLSSIMKTPMIRLPDKFFD